MILRRFSQHIKEQNWFAVGLDVIVVIVGIFLGLQVTEWNETRQNQNDADRFLVRLHTDLEMEIFGWERATEYYLITRKYTIDALKTYQKGNIEDPVIFLLSLYQASQIWNIVAPRGTYNELISSGRISLIDNQVTRDRLSNHYVRMDSLKHALNFNERDEFKYRRLIRIYMSEDVQLAIRQDCGDIYHSHRGNYYYLSLPGDCIPTFDTELARPLAEEMINNTEIRMELRYHLSAIDSRISALKNAIEIAKTTLSELERHR